VDFVVDQLGKNVAAAASRQEKEDEVIAAIRSSYLATDSDFLSQVRHTQYYTSSSSTLLDQVFALKKNTYLMHVGH
jgi:hypothetical protein